MEDITSEILMKQVMNVFRGSHLMDFDTMTFSLQVLYWAKISQSEELDENLKIQNYTYADTKRVLGVWKMLANKSNTLFVAYSNLEIFSHLSAPCVGEAIRRCVDFAEKGMLIKFDPTDCFFKVLGKEAGEDFLPPELADVMVAIARVSPNDTVYAPWSNSIQLAVRAARLGGTVYMETMQKTILPALISTFVEGKIDIVYGDPFRGPSAVENGVLRKFNISLSFPPINIRYTPEIIDWDLYGRFKERTISGNALAVWHIIAQTEGRAVIAVPNTLLFSPGGDRSLRDELLKQERIEAVVAMPSGIFAHTNIPFALLVLNMGKKQSMIRFVNAEADCFREPISKARARLIDIEGIVARATGMLTDEYVAEVKNEDVIKNDATLQVSRYVLSDSTQKINCLLASSQTKQLGDIVSIFRPFPMYRPRQAPSAEDEIGVWEVVTSDLPEFAYIAHPAKEVRLGTTITQRSMHQFLRPLDIVLIIKGSVGKVGIVPINTPPPGEGGWIIGQSAVVLRVKNHNIMSPKALAVYLRSPIGQSLLNGIAVSATTIALIQQRELERLMVVIPTMVDMAKIGNIIDEQATIQAEIEELKERQAKLSKHVWALV